MPRYDDETALEFLGDGHLLRISVSPVGGVSLVPNDELHRKITAEINEKCQHIFQVYYSIWTPEFFGGTKPLVNYETATDADGYAERDIVFLDGGRLKASFWMPAHFIKAEANTRGRPSTRETVIKNVADALAIQFYHTIRYLMGCFVFTERQLASSQAIRLLHPLAAPLMPLTHHRAYEETLANPDATRLDAASDILDKIIRDLSEKAPGLLAALYNLPDPRSLGTKWLEEGRLDAKGRQASNPLELPKVRELTRTLKDLVQLRLESAWTVDAIREQRRSAAAQDKVRSAEPPAGYSITRDLTNAIGLTRHPDKLPDDQALVRMAFEFEFDPSTIVTTKAYLRPLFAAATALGAFVKRRTVERSALATYGLRAWSKGFYGLQHPACEAALQICDRLPTELIPLESDRPRLSSHVEEMTV